MFSTNYSTYNESSTFYSDIYLWYQINNKEEIVEEFGGQMFSGSNVRIP